MTEKAVIYLPELNDIWLNQCIDHCSRRGYEYAVVAGDVDRVGHLLYRNGGGIVVMARPEHFRPPWLPQVEVVGDETRRLGREVADAVRSNEQASVARNAGAGRHRKNERRPRLIPRD